MTKLLPVPLGLLLLLWPVSAPAALRALRPIEPLVVDGAIICTTFSVADRGRWVTALHCQPEDDDAAQPMHIAGMLATPLQTWPDDDLLLLGTAIGVTGLRLAEAAPRMGERLTLFGYALGEEPGVYTEGLVAQPAFPGLSLFPMLMTTIPVCGGHSGSPIVTPAGAVVSMMQRTSSRPCGPYSLGLAYERLALAWPAFLTS